jgi:hypothetical protein
MIRTSAAATAGVFFTLLGCDAGEPLAPAAPHYECFRIEDPYAAGGDWHRGNFHMHSRHSDGALGGEKLVSEYHDAGYDVLSITDHNQYGDQDGGVVPDLQTDAQVHDWNGDGKLHPQRVHGSGVEAYVRDWSKPDFPWAIDSWRRPALAQPKDVPIVLPGAECTFGPFHIGVVGAVPGWIEPPDIRPGYIERTRQAGGIVFLAHPAEANANPGSVFLKLDMHSFDAIEIVNGLRLIAASGARVTASTPDSVCGLPLPWDATPLWDVLLSRGFRLWGLASDDSHTWPGASSAYPFSVFTMVRTPTPTPEGFLQALRGGAMYGSTGLLFSQLGVDGEQITVTAPQALKIRFIGWRGRVLAEFDAPTAVYRPHGDEAYVRVEATGPPLDKPWPAQAWSQPFWLHEIACSGAPAKRGGD